MHLTCMKHNKMTNRSSKKIENVQNNKQTGEQLHIWGNHQVRTQMHTEIRKIQKFQQLNFMGINWKSFQMKSSNVAYFFGCQLIYPWLTSTYTIVLSLYLKNGLNQNTYLVNIDWRNIQLEQWICAMLWCYLKKWNRNSYPIDIRTNYLWAEDTTRI